MKKSLRKKSEDVFSHIEVSMIAIHPSSPRETAQKNGDQQKKALNVSQNCKYEI